MTTPVHLGVDVGGTASRWTACDEDGQVLMRGRAGGATGHIFNTAERERLRAAFEAIFQALSQSGLVAQTLTAGLTGYGSAVSADLKAVLAEIFGVGAGDIVLTDDMILAYMANFVPGEGHLVSAGTGSIGLYMGEGGDDFVRVGGRGILIDDAGSGSWIALRALDQIYRTLDHSGAFDAVGGLARHLFNEIGGGEWHDVRQFVYAGDRGRIGALAVAVARAAEEGDAAALSILQRAGAELAQLAKALIARAGPRPIGFVGGVLKLHPLIMVEIRRHLAGCDVHLLNADASLAAAQLQAVGEPRWRQVLVAGSSIG